MIRVEWKKVRDKVYLDIELPVNVDGIVKIKGINKEVSSGLTHLEL